MAEQLQFNADPIAVLSTGALAGNYTGTLTVDYTTGLVTGSVATSPAAGSTLQNLVFSNFKESFDSSTNTFTLTSQGDGAVGSATTFSLTYQGMEPAAVNSSIAVAGALPTFGATNNVVAAVMVCFVEGTRIATPRGDVAIEALRVGDLVVTASGEHRPVKWLGHRTIDCRRHADPDAVMPVRIAAHAFGKDRPASDLFVSPGHAIRVSIMDDVLVPTSSLINGATVARITADTVTYWHVELDSHDIILANGLPTESYIDVGNRAFFLFGQGPVDPTRDVKTLSEYCLPFVSDEVLVQAVRKRMRIRALELGWTMADEPLADLRIEADGETIRPQVDGLAACFLLPAAAKDVWLVSETSVPANVAASADPRALGVFIDEILLDDGLTTRRDIRLDDERLCVGFHAPEMGEGRTRRWTAGRSRLPATLWEGSRGHFFLRVGLASAALPRWVAPEAVAAASLAPRPLSLVQAA